MKRSNASGQWGERVAAWYLRRHFYRILNTNFRSRFGEIDIIAETWKYLVFVEVKTRKNDEFASAADFVTHAKQQRLISTAQLYLSQQPTTKQPRFDVIEIYAPEGTQTKHPKVHHIQDAFQTDS